MIQMGLFYVLMAFAFVFLLIVNMLWIGLNVYFWITSGIQTLLGDKNFIETIRFSTYLKWILLVDSAWIIIALVFACRRKNFKTESKFHYLKYEPINNAKICIVIPAYNEEIAIESTVTDFLRQKNVVEVIVVDNHSTDNTVSIAKSCGARVITKQSNMGYAHSCVIGLNESLKTDANAIVIVEGDGTCNGYDIEKMIRYLDNCDMVVGTRQLQVLSEKGNQLGMIYVWGNFFLAKLIQIKFFSLLHMGTVQLTDVGCLYRIIRKESLDSIIHRFTKPKTNEVIPNDEFTLFMTIEALKNNLRIVEVPITFKKRLGKSKIGSDKKIKAIKLGLHFLWYILKS